MHYLSLVLKGISMFSKPPLSYVCSFSFFFVYILLTRIGLELLEQQHCYNSQSGEEHELSHDHFRHFSKTIYFELKPMCEKLHTRLPLSTVD